MKKVITLFSFIFIVGILVTNAQCCNKTALAENASEAISPAGEENASSVKAYYFHTSRRCVTCRNVERVTSEILKELYGEKITLTPVNLDNKETEELAKKMKVKGQSLLIINDTKQVNLTTDGFMLAMRDREKFKEKIKASVESLK